MKRLFIFRSVASGTEVILPVTPASYSVDRGRTLEPIDMQTVGTVLLPGLLQPAGVQLECQFPASERPYVNAGAVLEPMYYVNLFLKYMEEGERQRFIVSDSDTNAEVLIEGVTYGERDGTNDVYATLRLRGVQELSAPEVEHTEPEHNLPRQTIQETAAETAASPLAALYTEQVSTSPTPPEEAAIQQTYVVQRGDTLAAICQRFYGDSSLAYKLAGANGIANANLIHPGDVITLPDIGTLRTAQAAGGGSSGKAKTGTKTDTDTRPVYTITVVPDGDRNRGTADLSNASTPEQNKVSGQFKLTLKVRKGDRVLIHWYGDHGAYADYVRRGGATITNTSSMTFQAHMDETITIHWASKG